MRIPEDNGFRDSYENSTSHFSLTFSGNVNSTFHSPNIYVGVQVALLFCVVFKNDPRERSS
jgi:hypothetical protein